MEKNNLAITQLKIDIKSLLKWVLCTTEWDILIFSLLNDLNYTFNGYFTTYLKVLFFRDDGGYSKEKTLQKFLESLTPVRFGP